MLSSWRCPTKVEHLLERIRSWYHRFGPWVRKLRGSRAWNLKVVQTAPSLLDRWVKIIITSAISPSCTPPAKSVLLFEDKENSIKRATLVLSHFTWICNSLQVKPMAIFKEMPWACILRAVVKFALFCDHVEIDTLANNVRFTCFITLKRSPIPKSPVSESDKRLTQGGLFGATVIVGVASGRSCVGKFPKHR